MARALATVRCTVTFCALLTGAGCGTSVVPQQSDQIIDEALSNLEHAIQSNVSQIGYWDTNQQKFLTLTEDELRSKITTAKRVHIVTHGWQPEAIDLVQQFAAEPPALTAWDERLVVDGQRLNQNLDKLAAAFSSGGDDVMALGFSWLQDAARRSPEEVVALADINAARLVITLNQVMPAGWRASGGQIHLFGHSGGARLVTAAGSFLSPPPEHITLADGPEITYPPFFTPVDLNFIVLGNAVRDGRLQIGYGPGKTFIDNYVSALGIPYGAISDTDGVVDVLLDAPVALDAHDYSRDWYAAAAIARVPVGPGWSPLEDGVAPAASVYQQQWRAANGGFDSAQEFNLAPRPPAARIAIFAEDPGLRTVSLDGPAQVSDGPRMQLTEKASSIWTSLIDVNDSDKALTFEYLFDDYQPDALVIVWIENEVRFISLPTVQDALGLPSTVNSTWQRAVVGLSNVGSGSKTVRIGMRNTGGSIRAEGFAKVSLPQINPAFRPSLCGTVAADSLVGTFTGMLLMGLVSHRHRRTQRGHHARSVRGRGCP